MITLQFDISTAVPRLVTAGTLWLLVTLLLALANEAMKRAVRCPQVEVAI